jgi:hypothetical protein
MHTIDLIWRSPNTQLDIRKVFIVEDMGVAGIANRQCAD